MNIHKLHCGLCGIEVEDGKWQEHILSNLHIENMIDPKKQAEIQEYITKLVQGREEDLPSDEKAGG